MQQVDCLTTLLQCQTNWLGRQWSTCHELPKLSLRTLRILSLRKYCRLENTKITKHSRDTSGHSAVAYQDVLWEGLRSFWRQTQLFLHKEGVMLCQETAKGTRCFTGVCRTTNNTKNAAVLTDKNQVRVATTWKETLIRECKLWI